MNQKTFFSQEIKPKIAQHFQFTYFDYSKEKNNLLFLMHRRLFLNKGFPQEADWVLSEFALLTLSRRRAARY
jgi:hypothetical protein